ncbi:MAG: hypothetical protein ACYTHJ_04400 [Planctomycetota bacterium]
MVSSSQVVVLLNLPLLAGEVTRIAYQPVSGGPVPGGVFITFPGDVNGDLESNQNDIVALIEALDGTAPLPENRIDIDRNSLIDPDDLLRHIDLLNGGIDFEPWFGAVVNDKINCFP